MSHQHFYSRVPARVSLFNKRDGFDTFAHSLALNRDFILGELSAVYMDKLDIHDPVRLRRGEIPTVYSQLLLPSGSIAQTAVSYLPKDFTGERSAYLAHSLLLTNEERAYLYSNPNTDAFNPDMFVTDISAFDITARDAMGNSAFPDNRYICRGLTDPMGVIAGFNPDMLKSFIFSVVSAAIGGGRPVYFKLPCEDALASKRALELMNALMCVLPYSVRERLSFVSFVSKPEAYPGFCLKCVSQACSGVAPENGVFYDFTNGLVTGQPVEYKHNAAFASFLYSLFENRKIRDEFHIFVSRIVNKYPSLVLDAKALWEIIFMFWQCSGFYVENSILPTDDTMCRFMDIYAKYREGLTSEHRVQAYRPLARYSKAQIAIPDGVYTRLSRLYPTECAEAKAVALDVLLGLIHVDVMRDLLFAFISRNYLGEIDKVKAVINSNLCRVFYGGFLQQRILSHFDVHFEREPVQTRDLIIDKLLLSIRTPEIQRQIVAFIERHYTSLTPAQRLKVCTTCLEMIPECDGLSGLLVGLINRRIGIIGGDLASLVAKRLVANLDLTISHGDPRLLSIFIDTTGFCEDLAMHRILSRGEGVDILVSLLAAMPAQKRASKLIRICRSVPGLSDKEYGDLLLKFKDVPVNISPSTMYDIIGIDGQVDGAIPPERAELLRKIIIYPALAHTFLDAFNTELGKDGVKTAIAFASGKAALTGAKQYRLILDFVKLTELCRQGDTEGAFKIAYSLPDENGFRERVAEQLRMTGIGEDNESEQAECTYTLLLEYLIEEQFDFDALYTRYQSYYEELHKEDGGIRSRVEPADRRGAADAAELLISCVADICEASGELADIAISEDSGLRGALKSFISTYGLGAGVFLKKRCEESYFAIGDMVEELMEERNSSITSVNDALDLVLRRK